MSTEKKNSSQQTPTAPIEGELDLDTLAQISGGAVPKPRPVVRNTTR